MSKLFIAVLISMLSITGYAMGDYQMMKRAQRLALCIDHAHSWCLKHPNRCHISTKAWCEKKYPSI